MAEQTFDQQTQHKLQVLEAIIHKKREQIGSEGTLEQRKREMIAKINDLKAMVSQLQQRMVIFSPADRKTFERVVMRINTIEAKLVYVIGENHKVSLDVIGHLENAMKYFPNFTTIALAQQEITKARELVVYQMSLDRQIAFFSCELETFMKIIDKLTRIYTKQATELLHAEEHYARAA